MRCILQSTHFPWWSIVWGIFLSLAIGISSLEGHPLRSLAHFLNLITFFCPTDFFLLILRLLISLISAPFSFLLFYYSEFRLLFLFKFPKVTSQVIGFGALLLSRICICSCGFSKTGFPRVIHLAGYIFISSVCFGSCFQMSSRNYFRNAMPKVLTA